MDVDKKIVINLDELEFIEIPFEEFFSLQVNYNNIKYEFLIRFSSCNKNMICFSSRGNPGEFIPPFYNKHNCIREFEESMIFYQSSTLYNDDKLTLVGGVEKYNEWYLSVIANIINILVCKNHIENENILFIGSSYDEFTSIILSTMLKGSSVIVTNPQKFIKNYDPNHFKNIKNACFDYPDPDTILNEYGYIQDVIELFKREDHIPQITYLINTNSRNDLNNQLIPIINRLVSFKNFDGQIQVLMHPNDKKHSEVLEKEEIVKLIKNHFQDKSKLETQIDKIKKELDAKKNIIFELKSKLPGNTPIDHPHYQLIKELEAKEERIIELQTIKGYINYKTKNMANRFKNKCKKILTKIRKPYYESRLFLPDVDYNKLTIVIPYSKSADFDREKNLDITLRYLSSINIPNLIISEHSDISNRDFLMEKYKNLFKSLQVIHTNAEGEKFNRAKARNNGIIHSNTSYVATSDLDCLTKKKNIDIALGLLERDYDLIHPFNRRVTDIADKKNFIENYDFNTVKAPEQKRKNADGGIVFWNKRSFVAIGMENEYFLGWGGEDNEIMFRANLCNLKMYRIDDTLYHLYHHRPQKRTQNNVLQEEKTRQMKDKEDCLEKINKWPWVIKAKKKFSY